jgi:type II secretory pathway component PulF
MLNFLRTLAQSLRLSSFHKVRDEFYELMARAIDNKENIRDFLAAELTISKNPRTADSSRAAALHSMLKRIGEADEYTYAGFMGPVVPMGDRVMLAAVDESSDRAATLRALAIAVREQRQAKAVIVKALIPPLILVPGLGAFAWVIAAKSIPVISKIAPPEVWTPFNAAVRSFAEFLVGYGVPMIGLLVAAVMVFIYLLPRSTHRLRYRWEKMDAKRAMLLMPVAPWILPLGLYRDFQVGLMLSALAVLLDSGATLKDALETIRRAATPWMRVHVRRILSHLEDRPTEYVEAFSKGLVSARLLARLASTIRTTPQFDKVLIEVGTTGSVEIRKEIERSAKAMNAMLLAVAGVVLVFLYMGNASISQSMTEEMDPVKRMQHMSRR